jgi:hypothetical protein
MVVQKHTDNRIHNYKNVENVTGWEKFNEIRTPPALLERLKTIHLFIQA